MESLEIDAMGHGHHPCTYLSTFSFCRLMVFNLERPIPILNDIMEICPDLSSTHYITLYLYDFTSYLGDLHYNDNHRTLHIELTLVFPDFAEIWSEADEQQTRAFDRFMVDVSYLYPKLRLDGFKYWTED